MGLPSAPDEREEGGGAACFAGTRRGGLRQRSAGAGGEERVPAAAPELRWEQAEEGAERGG